MSRKCVAQMRQKSKARQQQKYERLVSVKSRADRDENWRDNDGLDQDSLAKERWVKNLSSRTLSVVEKDVLSRGLNFSVTPDRIPHVELITATESAIKHNQLDVAKADELRAQVTACLVNAKLPPSNISKEQRTAISTLGKDNNILVLPADKGRCTVVLDKSDYEEKANALLNDAKVYEPLKRDPTAGYKKKVIESLQQLEKAEAIDRIEYHKLYPGETVPAFYGLPKIHKPAIPLRPIVSSIDSVTYNVAKQLSYIIGPLVGKSCHHVANSSDLVDKLKDIQVEDDETLTSYDVSALFTCVPPDGAVEVVREFLLADTSLSQRTKLSTEQLCSLLELCLNSTYLVYDGKYYKQKHAMGSPVSHIVANLYMERFERLALQSYNGTPPTHWFRYVDDTLVKLKKSEQAPFFEHINAVDENIRFTQEGLHDNKLPFLDCLVTVENNGSLNTTVYRKSTHTDQYLLFDSHHPLIHKLGVIKTLFHRAENIPSTEEAKLEERNHLKSALGTCGYQNWTFEKALKPREKSKSISSDSSATRNTRPRNITIPYIAGVSEKLKRIFGKHNIPVSLKP
ncbi:uncharacterized protein [Amphiura filiformis]|uniref:uncharacterized protein n=1 Tax=Amphiura filiformis TaxID=82378 RepID=UPI003B221F4F